MSRKWCQAAALRVSSVDLEFLVLCEKWNRLGSMSVKIGEEHRSESLTIDNIYEGDGTDLR